MLSAPLVAGQKSTHSAKDTDNLLMNVAGKLLVFQRDRSGPQIKQKEKSSPHKQKPVCNTNIVLFWGNKEL